MAPPIQAPLQVVEPLESRTLLAAASFTASPLLTDKFLFAAVGSEGDVGSPLVRYHWRFGDGTSASGRTVRHTYAKARDYTVQLTVTTELGSVAATTRTVQTGDMTASASITGLAFNDLDHDGVRDRGEPGANAILVFLDLNNNGNWELGGASAEPGTYTDAGGWYSLPGLRAGTYRLRRSSQSFLHLPTNYNKGVAVKVDAGTEAICTHDFGQASGWSIIGKLYADDNADGSSAGDASLKNRTVWLDLNDNGLAESAEPTTTTHSTGSYQFAFWNSGSAVLKFGTKSVRAVMKSGETQTRPKPGTGVRVRVTSDKDFRAAAIHIAPRPASSISGTLFNDLNGNGWRNVDEPSINEGTIFTDFNDNGRLDAGELSADVDWQGRYTFKRLRPRNDGFRIVAIAPSGWRSISGSVYILRNGDVLTHDVGRTTSSRISGKVFRDDNGDGIRQDDEDSADWLDVYLDLNRDGRQQSSEPRADVGSNGAFFFYGVEAGSYVVRVITFGTARVSTPSSGSYSFTLGAGDERENLLFGLTPT